MEDVLRSCCAGLDIHQKVIVACIIRSAEGKPNRIQAFFFRVRRNAGHKKSVVATVHLLVRIIYQMFSDQSRYNELGGSYLQNRSRTL